jgi:hypothetical protein
MRNAIWTHYANDLQLGEVEIDITKIDAKNIWEQLKNYMPLYSLFQSDRKNSDGDSEIQDPMKLAVQEILKDTSIQSSLNAFNESDDGYHNELYGYIESEGWLQEYKNGKPTQLYNKEWRGSVSAIQIIQSEYIHHQIHHPENTHNQRFTTTELGQSISEMRTFIVEKQNA